MPRPQRFQTCANLLIREVDDGVVLFDTERGFYFGLDPVGLRILQLIANGLTIEEICETLLAEYAVSLQQVKKDVDALVADLMKHSLIIAG